MTTDLIASRPQPRQLHTDDNAPAFYCPLFMWAPALSCYFAATEDARIRTPDDSSYLTHAHTIITAGSSF